MKTRGGKAHRNAFIDILAEVKQMLRHMHPCIQQMPKIERMDGAGAEMRRAAYAIIRCYYIAYRCQESRLRAIEELVGWYGHLETAFEQALLQGIVKEQFKLPIAERMERIEKGVLMWLQSQQSAQRQERGTCTVPRDWGEAAVTDHAE